MVRSFLPKRLASSVIAAVFVLAVSPRAAERRPIRETDLLQFVWVADPRISPDGSTVAFVKVTVNDAGSGYDTSIEVVPAIDSAPATPRPLTTGPRDSAPRWSPDGRRLAFLRSVERNGHREPAQIYVIDMSGGEARRITDLPRGAAEPAWSPDGRTLAFTTTTLPDELKAAGPDRTAASGQRQPDATRATDESRTPSKSDVKVITRAVYRENGEADFLDTSRHSHIWTIAAPDPSGRAATPRPITSGDFDEARVAWSPDGTALYFTSLRVAEPYYDEEGDELYRVPASGGEMTRVAAIDGGIGQFAVAPDGARVAFVGEERGQPIRSYRQPDLWIADTTGSGRPRNLTADYDFDIGGGIGGDQAAPRGGNPAPVVWSMSSGRASLVVVASEHGSANLKRVDAATGTVEPVTAGDQAVVSYSGSRDGSRLAVVISTATAIGDLDLVRAGRAPERPVRLTHLNAELFDTITQNVPEEFWYTSFDGQRINGWILKPPDFDVTKKYPLILEIHGGPHSAYGNVYTHEFMWLAAKGYVVVYVNPRGSSAYGQVFGNIIQFHYPGDDYKDLMAGVDEVLKKGYVDPERLGVTGGSGGGLLTNWTITQTRRFKAAVAQRDIADWAGFWFTADFTQYQPFWFRKAP